MTVSVIPCYYKMAPACPPPPAATCYSPGAGLIMVTSHTGHHQPQYYIQTLEYSWEMKTVHSKGRLLSAPLWRLWMKMNKDITECVCVLGIISSLKSNNLTDHRGNLRHCSNPGLWLVSSPRAVLWLADPRAPSRDHYRIITTHFTPSILSGLTPGAPRTLGVVNWALIEIKTLKTLPGGEEKLTSKWV